MLETEVSRKIGLRIVELRRVARKSCEQLAFDIGISSQQMWKYEAGVNRITVDRLVVIAGVLGVSVVDFFSDVDLVGGGVRLVFSKRDYQLLSALKQLRKSGMCIDDVLLSYRF